MTISSDVPWPSAAEILRSSAAELHEKAIAAEREAVACEEHAKEFRQLRNRLRAKRDEYDAAAAAVEARSP